MRLGLSLLSVCEVLTQLTQRLIERFLSRPPAVSWLCACDTSGSCCVLMAILFGPCIKCVVRMRARRGKGAVNVLDTIGLNAEEALAAFDTAQEEKKEQERRARRAAAASAAAATGAATSTTVTVFGRPVALGPAERTYLALLNQSCARFELSSGRFSVVENLEPRC